MSYLSHHLNIIVLWLYLLDDWILLGVINEGWLWHNPQIAPTQIPPSEKLDLERGRVKKEEWSRLRIMEMNKEIHCNRIGIIDRWITWRC